jgi:hypothetical protein
MHSTARLIQHSTARLIDSTAISINITAILIAARLATRLAISQEQDWPASRLAIMTHSQIDQQHSKIEHSKIAISHVLVGLEMKVVKVTCLTQCFIDYWINCSNWHRFFILSQPLSTMSSPQISALKASKTTTAMSRADVSGLLKLSTNRPPFLPVDVNVRDNGTLL